MTHWLQLVPFSSQPMNYSVQAKAENLQNKLTLTFELTDPQNQVFWQKKENQIKRQDFLWESTCFEAFISTPNQTPYFELNLSPSLAWNLYRFTNYRIPNAMPPIRVIEPALIKFEIVDRTMIAEIDLNALQLADQEITLGLTAVIKTANSIEYLAIYHPKSEADFHDARGWTIRLLPKTQFPESIVDKKAKNP